jgi:hypothetical protein
MGRARSSLTYANVMATVAVFLALGGGAYAAFKLPKNSVGSKQIKSNAVTSAKVKDRTLLAGDFKPGQLPVGAAGAAGAAGAQGPKGDPGTNGVNGTQGPAGPTEGTASDFYTRLSDALPAEQNLDSQTLTTTRPGKLYVSKTLANITATCSPSTSAFRLFPTVDGTRAPGFVTKSYASGSTVDALTLTGITATSVAAGDHTIAVGIECVDGTLSVAGASGATGELVIVLG